MVVTNSSDIDRPAEVVEIEGLDNPEEFIVLGEDGYEVPSQVTYDGKLLLQANVAAGSSQNFKLVKSERRMPFTPIATGRIYPERIDDIAWESDKIGYRVYSKKAGEDGWRLFGYDIFTKIGERPVLDDLYAAETNLHDRALVLELAKTDPKASQTLYDAISYHINHGQGMDYYPVGPTLGCGTSALVVDGVVHYPEYFRSYEILDEGGLRFTFKITFDPIVVGDDSVVEERIISLDAGQHFNKIEVNYKNLTTPRKVIVGLVMHDEGEVSQIEPRSIAYAEPAHSSFGWQTYVAAIFPETMTPRFGLFSDSERAARGATGHLQTEGVANPDESISYYMGAGWNRWIFTSADEWFDYVKQQEVVLNNPLEVTLSK